MAKKKQIKNINEKCKDCIHSHSYYEKNWEGMNFMCKCKHSQYSKLLNQNCDEKQFKQK